MVALAVVAVVVFAGIALFIGGESLDIFSSESSARSGNVTVAGADDLATLHAASS